MRRVLIFFVFLFPALCSGGIIRGVLRALFTSNFAPVERGTLYRSGMMSIRRLSRTVRKYGIKSVINLRGAHPNKGWWKREKDELDRHSVKMYDIAMCAHTLPSKKNVLALLDAFKHGPYPMLIHCRGGADRTGEAVALWMLTERSASKQEALKHLSASHGHIKKRYKAKSTFIKMLPEHNIKEWIQASYTPSAYPRLNAIHSPRTYPGTNFYTVTPHELYRSAQLTPSELSRYIDRYKIKTIINLIGAQPTKVWYQQQKALAAHRAVHMHDIPFSYDYLPEPEHLRRLLFLYETAPRPLLIHCRDGADRTGEAAALWLLHIKKRSISEALKQLHIKYKHFLFAHPGKRFFIKNWKGSSWAQKRYSPELLGKYINPKRANRHKKSRMVQH